MAQITDAEREVDLTLALRTVGRWLREITELGDEVEYTINWITEDVYYSGGVARCLDELLTALHEAHGVADSLHQELTILFNS